MIALDCQQFTAPIVQIRHKEKRLVKKINDTQSIRRSEHLIRQYQHYDHQISKLIYKQDQCDDILFLGERP